jgi:C4-dicarboxylate-binding protein DctP
MKLFFPQKKQNKEGNEMKRGWFRQLFVVLASIILLVGLGMGNPAAAAEKKVIKLRIGSGHPTATVWIKYLSDFYCKEIVKRVNEKTDYRLELAEHWAGSVAKLGEELEAVEIGILDMAMVIASFEPTKLLLHNWGFNIPFYTGDPIKSMKVGKRIYQQFPILKNEFKKYNQIWLGAGGHDDYNLITNFPVRKTEDLKGRKIAAAGPNLPWISGTGAIPVQSNLNEAFTSLQTGVYDGWVMFPSGIVGFKLYEVSKYYQEINFASVTMAVHITINQNVWEKLPKEVQKILQETADEYVVKEAEYVADLTSKNMKTLQENGVNIYKIPQEEKVKWAKMIINQPKKWAKEADAKGYPGTAIMNAVMKYAEEEGHVFPRKWMAE